MNKGVVTVLFFAGVLLFSTTFASAGWFCERLNILCGTQIGLGPIFDGPNQTHLECRNYTCTRVNGAGKNTCSPEGSYCSRQVILEEKNNMTVNKTTPTINQTHLRCINNMCTVVNGNGTNQCSIVGAYCNNTNGSIPDLIIESHAFEYTNLSGNTTHRNVTVVTRVTNVGSGTATVSYTRLQVWAHKNYSSDRWTQDLAPGESVDLRGQYTLPRGYWYAYSYADQNGDIREIRETNNGRTTGFSV